MNDTPRCLIIHLNALGDVVRGTAVVRALKQLKPRARIDFLTEESVAPLLYHHPDITDVYALPHKSLKKRVQAGESPVIAAHECLHTLAERLRAARYDLVVNLHFSQVSGVLSGLAGDAPVAGLRLTAKGECGAAGPVAAKIRKLLQGDKKGRAANPTPLYAWYVALLRDAGLDPDVAGAETRLVPTGQELHWADDFLAYHGVESGDLLVGMHPGAGWKAKRWPTDRFTELADHLAGHYHAKILLTGVPVELEKVVRPIAENTRAKTVLAAGQTDLRQTMALMKLCTLFVAGDTGPMHMASAMNVPTLALFATEFAHEVRPCGAGHAVVLADAMDALSTSDAIRTADMMLHGTAPNGNGSSPPPAPSPRITPGVNFLTSSFPVNQLD